MKNNYLPLEERWRMDMEAADAGGAMVLSIPQCETCNYWVKKNALQCEKYAERKPKEVLSCKKECREFAHQNPLSITVDNKAKELLMGGVFGFCVGDALGVPVEFSSRKEREKDPVQEMRAYGTYHQYFGTWSDDSSLTFCLMDGLRDGYDLKNIAKTFVQYLVESLWTPFDEIFDIGNTTIASIQRIKAGFSLPECGGSDDKDNGNGSLMRILPLAFFLKNTKTKEKIRIIEEVSALTHAHARSKLACIFYVEYAINLLAGYDKNSSYSNTVNFVLESCEEEYQEELSSFERILNQDLVGLKEEEIQSSGYVIDTLEASLWSFMTTTSYMEAIFKAINLGEDTDTIAAITGGIAGIFYGITSIPDNWIQCIAKKESIYQLCHEFAKACE